MKRGSQSRAKSSRNEDVGSGQSESGFTFRTEHGTESVRQAAAELRKRAEESLRVKTDEHSGIAEGQSSAETQTLLHELLVHQIELELQNEELLRVQLQLDSERERYFNLYDLAPVGYVTITPKGMIQQANLTAVRLLGDPRATLVTQAFSHYVLRVDQDSYYLHIAQLLKTGEPQSFELRLVSFPRESQTRHLPTERRSRDGVQTRPYTEHWVQLEATIGVQAGAETTDHVIRMTLSDISDRKENEFALKESESRWRNLLQDVQTVSVYGCSIDGKVQYWNQAAERLFGYSAREAIGRNLLELIIPPELRETVSQSIRHMAATGQAVPASEITINRKDGSQVTVFSNQGIVQIPGAELEIFSLDIDLTARKQAEKALEVMNVELQNALAREQKLARTDVLTDIHNRRRLFELAEQELKTAARKQQPLTVIMLDIDHFKTVNDTFGHTVGDQLLQLIAQTAQAELNSVNTTAGTDRAIFGRYGGEEFLILLPNTKIKAASIIAEQIRAKVAALRVPANKDNETADVTLSIGLYEHNGTPNGTTFEINHNGTMDDIIHKADQAMYIAKRNGRNRIEIYSGE